MERHTERNGLNGRYSHVTSQMVYMTSDGPDDTRRTVKQQVTRREGDTDWYLVPPLRDVSYYRLRLCPVL